MRQPWLVDHIMREHCAQTGRPIPEITPEAMAFLCSLPYPGNIRELKNFIERTLLVSPGDHLDEREFRSQYDGAIPMPDSPTRSSLEMQERESVEQAIAHSGGNLTRAAALLGITRQSLYRRMEKYGIKGN